MAAKNRSNELKLTRLYDAPVKAVWDAWTDPKKAAKWWGPRGFTITTHSKDLRVGGSWHYTMHGPDGTDYENTTKYLEVDKYARLVYDHGGHADRPPLFRVTVLFNEIRGKTQMEMTMSVATPEAADEIKKIIKQANGNSTWDRLAEYLAEEQEDRHPFVINRSFAAPMALVFEMWTNPEHLAKWLPPTGFDCKFMRSAKRPGESSFYSMSNPQVTMYGKSQYTEMQPPHRIVYLQQFCDENEKTTRHPMAPTWPETMKVTVTLHEEGPNQTRVTISSEVYGQATAEERDTFLKARGGMTQGWTGSFDKLEDYLSRQL